MWISPPFLKGIYFYEDRLFSYLEEVCQAEYLYAYLYYPLVALKRRALKTREPQPIKLRIITQVQTNIIAP